MGGERKKEIYRRNLKSGLKEGQTVHTTSLKLIGKKRKDGTIALKPNKQPPNKTKNKRKEKPPSTNKTNDVPGQL